MNGRLIHRAGRARGFTLVEIMVVVAIVAILAAIAYPGYTNYVVRSHRAAAQQELISLAALQEKIYLNSSNYATSMTANYTGLSTGGLGRTNAHTSDDSYTLAVTVPAGAQSFTLTATPIAGTMQEGDGAVSVDSSGIRLWGSQHW